MSEDRREQVNEMARPVREFFQKMIRKKIKTREDRQKLADFLGIKLSSLPNMLYKGEGGLNLWLATLIYCYQLDVEKITHFFENYQQLMGKVDQLTEADRQWQKIGNELGDDDKLYAAELVKSSIELHKDIYQKKKTR